MLQHCLSTTDCTPTMSLFQTGTHTPTHPDTRPHPTHTHIHLSLFSFWCATYMLTYILRRPKEMLHVYNNHHKSIAKLDFSIYTWYRNSIISFEIMSICIYLFEPLIVVIFIDCSYILFTQVNEVVLCNFADNIKYCLLRLNEEIIKVKFNVRIIKKLRNNYIFLVINTPDKFIYSTVYSIIYHMCCHINLYFGKHAFTKGKGNIIKEGHTSQ